MIYLDNAATTSVLPEVADVIHKAILENYGNPSSTHQIGRKSKAAIEMVRKQIAKQFNVSSSELIFTSGGTESNNLVLINAVEKLKVKHIISSRIEHHAVLHVIEKLQEKHSLKVSYVNLENTGVIDLEHLNEILGQSEEKTLVSLMMINNEIGNILPIDKVSKICIQHNALLHSDTAQAIGHYEIDLKKIPIDFITASGHKFHATKGVGFLYAKKGIPLFPVFYGGGQEKGRRPGTENVPAIIGLGKALEIAYSNLEKDKAKQLELKKLLITELKLLNSEIQYNGLSEELTNSSYTILNVRFPKQDDMFLFSLDMHGVAASRGSACQSGANSGSHVLNAILLSDESKKTSIRFSISKLTTEEDIMDTIAVLKKLE